MTTTIYRTGDPTLETIEYGAVYRICAPRTGDSWGLYKVSDDCGVDSTEPLEVPEGWDDAYEYPMGYRGIWSRLARLAMDAYFADATLEVAFASIIDEEAATDSYALLYRFIWPN